MDLIITDPPYNVNYEEKVAALNEYRPNENGAMEIKNDLMDRDSFYTFLFKAFCNMEACMREGADVYVFHADIEGLTFRKAFDAAGKVMKINTEYISTNNTYHGKNIPKYIVIHETDNWSPGAGAKRHAQAQAAGHLSTSVHYYCGR